MPELNEHVVGVFRQRLFQPPLVDETLGTASPHGVVGDLDVVREEFAYCPSPARVVGDGGVAGQQYLDLFGFGGVYMRRKG